ncbi:hypothetical protein HID58_006406, partial [Brassica napus]
SVLLREAAELMRQAEKDGVRAYLEKPNVRHRPNSRFLTATVLVKIEKDKPLLAIVCDILLFVEAIVFSVGEVSGGGFRCGSDDLCGCGGRRGEEQNDGVMGGKKLLQQEDLLALRPSSCSACLLQIFMDVELFLSVDLLMNHD